MQDTVVDQDEKGTRLPNPLRLGILAIGLGLARLGVIGRDRATKTTELAWPRVVTGIARMSKNAVDVAMVGAAVGTTAVAGVGFAGPYWGAAFSIGGGVAGGTIALVSQRYGAAKYGQLGTAVRSSALLAFGLGLPMAVLFWTIPDRLIGLLSSNPAAIEEGATYLQIVGLGVPFAALNLVGSRVMVGTDDAYTAMQIRAGGAAANIVINAVLIFGAGLGVAGAAIGTVVSNLLVSLAFAGGLLAGGLPLVGSFPVRIDPTGTYLDPNTVWDIVEIGLPVAARNSVWVAAEFPLFAILDLFGEPTVAAFVIARRIWGIMNTPGWGFGLASSSLVGQALGQNDEQTAAAYGRDIIRFSATVYVVGAVLTAAFAEQIVVLFAESPTSPEVPIAVNLIYAAAIAVVFQGISGASAGPLDASGDTRVPFVARALGLFGGTIPLVYVGAADVVPSVTVPFTSVTTPEIALPAIGLWGLYLGFLAETTVPAAINYWRFRSGTWKRVSEAYRPDAPVADD